MRIAPLIPLTALLMLACQDVAAEDAASLTADLPERSDQVQFVIDSSNLNNHAEKLSDGQRALFAAYPDSFRMPVYPTVNSHRMPQWLIDNSTANTTATEIDPDSGVLENFLPGVPFPEPANGLELIHNHLLRWRGQQLDMYASDANVYDDGKYTLITRRSRIRFDFVMDGDNQERLFSLVSRVTAPARRSGSGVLVLEPVNRVADSRSAWIWDAGRRKALRAPDAAYDTPVSVTDGLLTADDVDLFNGATDRYDWQIVGRKTLYVPYNNDRLDETLDDIDALIQPGHINPQHTRHELREVWHLKASLKNEWRHVYSQRDFYIDPDSWSILLAEQYDQQGQLWRVNLSYLRHFDQVPATLPVVNVYHDLRDRRYHVQGMRAGKDQARNFDIDPIPDSQFTPAGLRRFVR